MQSQKLLKMLLMAISALVVSCDKFPEITPCFFVDIKDQTCRQFRLVDKEKVIFKFEKEVPMSELRKGWIMPQGQLEATADWARSNNCKK